MRPGQAWTIGSRPEERDGDRVLRMLTEENSRLVIWRESIAGATEIFRRITLERWKKRKGTYIERDAEYREGEEKLNIE